MPKLSVVIEIMLFNQCISSLKLHLMCWSGDSVIVVQMLIDFLQTKSQEWIKCIVYYNNYLSYIAYVNSDQTHLFNSTQINFI